MAVSAAERRFLLDQVDRIAQGDLIRLWSTAEQLADGDFFDFVMAGFPDIASTYYELAGQIAANWFEEAIPLRNFTPQPAELLPTERLVESAEWALGGDGVQARDRLSGTLQRAVYDGARDTTAVNAEATGSRWIRVARATACEFCKLLATRTDENYTYRSKEAALGVVGRSVNLSDADRRAIASGQMTRAEALARRDRMSTAYQIGRRKGQARSRQLRGTRAFGAKYHDFCHCTAKEIPAGVDALELLAQDDPQSAALVAQWTEEYEKAVANAGGTNTKQVLAQWRQQNASIVQVETPQPEVDPLPSLPRKSESEIVLERNLVRRTGRPEQVAIRDANSCNPGWVPEQKWTSKTDKAYMNNCTHTVNAYELRRRGYDVEATRNPRGGKVAGRNLNSDILNRWVDKDGNQRAMTLSSGYDSREVDEAVKSWGQGSRGWVLVAWEDGGGHIFTVENVGGRVVYLEPQHPMAGDGTAKSHFSRVKKKLGSVQYMRVDDLTPTPAILDPEDPLVRSVAEGKIVRKNIADKIAKAEARRVRKREREAAVTPSGKEIMEAAKQFKGEYGYRFTQGIFNTISLTPKQLAAERGKMSLPEQVVYQEGVNWYKSWLASRK